MIPDGVEKIIHLLVIAAILALAVLALFGFYVLSEVIISWQSSS